MARIYTHATPKTLTRVRNGKIVVIKSRTPEAIDERKRRFLELLAETGGNKLEASRRMGIHKSNHTYWMKHDPEFTQACKDVKTLERSLRAELLEETIYDIAIGKKTVDGMPSLPAAKYLLGKYNREEFSDTVQHQHTGTVFHTYVPDPLTLDQLEVVDDTAISARSRVVEEDDDEAPIESGWAH